MLAPEFWAKNGLPARLLSPAGAVYGMAGRLRRRMVHGRRAPVAVICVGNLTVGGAGKTPTALALGRRLAASGHRPHFLTRGYGGTARGPVRVDPARHDAALVGDEALLLALAAPTWVARDRCAGARAAAAAGAGLLILDDGFQNPRLALDLSLIVVDGTFGFGNRRLLPAGPLREPVAEGLRRASAVVRVGPDRAGIDAMLPKELLCLEADLEPEAGAPALAGRRVVAFAGIATPGRFFATVAGLGGELVGRRAFADHHRYRDREVEHLLAEAERQGALCLTTAKDWVRLPPKLRARVAALPIALTWRDPAALERLLAPVLPASRAITT